MGYKQSTKTQEKLAGLANHIKGHLLDLLNKISAEPELHTKSYSRGSRWYDRTYITGGKLYFVGVSFDWMKKREEAFILDIVVEEIRNI